MFKKIFCILFVLISVCTTFSAFAEGEAKAFLSDVITEKNQLFETTLSVNTSVSAFVLSIEFDENKVEFKGAKATSENSETSINCSEKGKVILAFLNEDGTQGEILSFTFKSKDKDTFIDLSLNQVIDKNAKDVSFDTIKGADVSIITKTNKEEEKEVKTTAVTTKVKGEDKNINLAPDDSKG